MALLAEYHRKRRFKRTPEPRGRVHRANGAGLFVIQKHDASRLHYDFRLELDGVLKSWAVPKGPSFDPHEKRLAVEVEDHPLEYGEFEGIIPEGEYGGGTVILWDRGHWQPEGDAHEGLRKGRLKFSLEGDRLEGRWMLVRMPRRAGERSDNWLLIKERDAWARPLDEFDILDQTTSVATGRSLEEVAGQRDRVWTKDGELTPAAVKKLARGKKLDSTSAPRRGRKTSKAASSAGRKGAAVTANSLAKLKGVRKAALPKELDAALTTLVDQPPEGDQWLHEIKLDGYRLFARRQRNRWTLTTRRGQDWTDRFSGLVAGLESLPVRQAILDGEAVVLDDSGVSRFQLLQNALSAGGASPIFYYAFDLLYLDGYDLRKVRLEERKKLLDEVLVAADPSGALRYCEHIRGGGPAFFANCCKLGLEGMLSKSADGPYLSGRTREWLKIKCWQRQEFVIGGYTDSSDRQRGFGSLLVGYYNDQHELAYAGRVGTGWTEQSMARLAARLQKLKQSECPFGQRRSIPKAGTTHWVRPELVAEISFSNWTDDGRLRHPSFQGLREDKRPEAIGRELPDKEAAAKAEEKTSRRGSRAKKKQGKGDRAGSRTPKSRSGSSGERTSRTKAASTNGRVARTRTTESEPVEVEGVRLSNPQRVLYAPQGITKLDLAQFYVSIADWILPYLEDRPLVLVRCPQGHGKECFFQKHLKEAFPRELKPVEVKEGGGRQTYAMAENVQGLVALVQMGVLEIHPWQARADMLEKPDRLIFDLDPDPTVPWERVIAAARRLRVLLADLRLQSFLKTTGGKGLHLVVPIERRREWPVVKQFAKGLVEYMAGEAPGEYTTNMSKAARKNRIYLDYLRNDRGATAVAAYSTRARAGAPVSTPITWEELTPELRPDAFNVNNLPLRLRGRRSDPWKGFWKLRQRLPAEVF